jgi:hypothetical protein
MAFERILDDLELFWHFYHEQLFGPRLRISHSQGHLSHILPNCMQKHTQSHTDSRDQSCNATAPVNNTIPSVEKWQLGPQE